jgi:molybdopterin converting factor small subunit
MRFLTAGLLALVAAALGGCLPTLGSSAPAEAPVASGAEVRENTRMTLQALDQHCQAFGERYVNAFRNATDLIEQKAKDLNVRAQAHAHKLRTASSAYDILSGPSPFAKLMDLILLVELQHRVWVTDQVAVKVYGPEAAPPLVAALTEGRADVWRMAEMVLKPEQRKIMEEMIDAWRARNSDVEAVAYVRFSEFSDYRGKSILDGVPLGSGLLAPVSEAMRQIEESRLLAERGFYLAKRMPQLLRWQAEALLNTALLHPDIRKLNDTAARVAATVESLPAKIAEERAAILKRMEEREKAIGAIVQDVRATAADVKDTAKEFRSLLAETQGVVKAADGLFARFSPADGKESRPFDIRDYTATVRELRELLESPAWNARLSDVDQTAKSRVSHASEELGRLVYTIFWLAGALVVLILAAAMLYRATARPARPRADAPS